MANFSIREKEIINKIASYNTEDTRLFEKILCDVMLNNPDIGIFISSANPTSSYTNHICQLLTLDDGGKTNKAARVAIIELISLMQFLEEQRLVLIVDGPSMPDCVLLYNKEQYYLPQKTLADTWPLIQDNSNTYKIPLKNNATLEIKETVSNGYRTSIYSDIKLQDGNYLSPTGYGNNLKPYLLKLLTSFVYPTAKLRDFIENDFQSADEIYNENTLKKANAQIEEAKKQVKRGTQAVVIAMFTLLLTSITSFFQLQGDWLKWILGSIAVIIMIMCGYALRDGQDSD